MKIENFNTFDFILARATANIFSIFIMIATAAIWALDFAIKPIYLKKLFDSIGLLKTGNQSDIVYYAFIYFSFTSMVAIAFRIYGYFVEIVMLPKLKNDIVTTFSNRTLGQTHSFFQHNMAGTISSKITELANSTCEVLQIVIDRFLANALGLSFAIFSLWQVNIKFSLIIIVWTTAFFIVASMASKHITDLSDSLSSFNSFVFGQLTDIFVNISSIRIFTKKDEETRGIKKMMDESNARERKLNWSFFGIWTFYDILNITTQLLSFALLLDGCKKGTITVGDFVLVLTINLQIYSYFGTIFRDISQFSKHYGRVAQALKTLKKPILIVDSPNAKQLLVKEGKIVFENVEFYYKDGCDPFFSNKSVTINPKEKVGLVGLSGSGKSTFTNLILRLFDVSLGKIFIDDQCIKDVTQESLHKSISLIPQEAILFHRTIFENIRYGKSDATVEEVIEACKKARLHDFISGLPSGYRTIVGERGSTISGGQRQRISIARAILKNAPILILDEATSQLDSITEGQIQESIKELSEGKTVIIIAHRLATLSGVDRILVFDAGKIIQDGTHEELIKQKDGLYERLWHKQNSISI